ncbi:hypothetical protein ACFL2V_01050 [Pseudomonadota bacterium]
MLKYESSRPKPICVHYKMHRVLSSPIAIDSFQARSGGLAEDLNLLYS